MIILGRAKSNELIDSLRVLNWDINRRGRNTLKHRRIKTIFKLLEFIKRPTADVETIKKSIINTKYFT